MTGPKRIIGRNYKGNAQLRIRSGASLARDANIDNFITPKDCEMLYRKWKKDKWDEPLQYRGGLEAITCEMILKVSLVALTKVYGKKRAKRFLAAASKGTMFRK